jgi:hypothetical protein
MVSYAGIVLLRELRLLYLLEQMFQGCYELLYDRVRKKGPTAIAYSSVPWSLRSVQSYAAIRGCFYIVLIIRTHFKEDHKKICSQKFWLGVLLCAPNANVLILGD